MSTLDPYIEKTFLEIWLFPRIFFTIKSIGDRYDVCRWILGVNKSVQDIDLPCNSSDFISSASCNSNNFHLKNNGDTVSNCKGLMPYSA